MVIKVLIIHFGTLRPSRDLKTLTKGKKVVPRREADAAEIPSVLSFLPISLIGERVITMPHRTDVCDTRPVAS